MSEKIEENIALIGAGNMGRALLEGLLASGTAQASQVMVTDAVKGARERVVASYGVQVTTDPAELGAFAKLFILAVKPVDVIGAVGALGAHLRSGAAFLSVAAGIATSSLESALPEGTAVVRAMPNTPTQIREGATAIALGRHADVEHRELAKKVFSAVGTVQVVKEPLLDAVTGLSGSGPAYVYTVIEALSDAGVKQGLNREVALNLAAQTVRGAAGMVLSRGTSPALLREQVTSPGGTTIAGVVALEENGLRAALMRAVEAATKRSKELGE